MKPEGGPTAEVRVHLDLLLVDDLLAGATENVSLARTVDGLGGSRVRKDANDHFASDRSGVRQFGARSANHDGELLTVLGPLLAIRGDTGLDCTRLRHKAPA